MSTTQFRLCALAILTVQTACAPRMVPDAVVVSPKPATLAGDTLRVRIVDRRVDRRGIDSTPAVIVSALRQAYPQAIIRQLPDTEAGGATPNAVTLQLGLVAHRVTPQTTPGQFSGQWVAEAELTAFLTDRRGGDSASYASEIKRRDTRPYGATDQGALHAARQAFANAVSALVAFVDSATHSDRARERVARAEAARLEAATIRREIEAAPQEYAPYLVTTGTASIAGQAFLTTRGGDVKRAAGRSVTLDPVTAVSRRWYHRVGQSIEGFAQVPQPETIFRAARRVTVADADGRFQFNNLPAGTYILRTLVTWEAPTGGSGLSMQGGVVSEVVTLRDGERQEVILSQTGNALLR
jgi:hypothetical protein